MNIRDLMPVRRKPAAVARRADSRALESFHREIDRLFDSVFEEFGLPSPWRPAEDFLESGWPAVNVAESDKDVVVTAELPGLDEKDIALELHGEVLTLRGETLEEHEEKDRRWTRIERTAGQFHRSIQLPAEVREEGAKASFKRGVLTVTLPKADPEQSKRKVIAIE